MGDGLRRVARAYYERASEDERDEAKHLFAQLDLDGDHKISLEEFKRGFDSRLTGEEFFEKLDSDSDGFLGFSDFLVLFYHKKKAIIISSCDECHQKILGPYFSCVLCLDHYPHTYDLCCDCHRLHKSKHQHPSSFMLHDQAALAAFTQTRSQPPKSGMEEMRAMAEAHFKASSAATQDKAKKFFTAMDGDGDGKVELSEFLTFMKGKGYKMTATAEFFKKLDGDDNGSLDFWEVMTLYYVIKSGRPFCDCCGEFIPSTYFSCVNCFKAGDSFDLCLRCYSSAKFEHDRHASRPQFLDNFALLNTIQSDHIPGQVDFAFKTLGLAIDIFGAL